MRVMLVGLSEETAGACAALLAADGVETLVCPNVSFAIVERVRFEPDGVLAVFQETAASNLMRHFGSWNGGPVRPWVLVWSEPPLPWTDLEFARLDLDDWLEGPASPAQLVRRLRQGMQKASGRSPPAVEVISPPMEPPQYAAAAAKAQLIAAEAVSPCSHESAQLRAAAALSAAQGVLASPPSAGPKRESSVLCDKLPAPAWGKRLDFGPPTQGGAVKRCNSLDRLAQWMVQLFASSQHDVRSLLDGVVNILAVSHLVVSGLDREPEDAAPIYLGPVPDWRRAAQPLDWPSLKARILAVVDAEEGRPFLWNVGSASAFPPSLYGIFGPPTGGLWLSTFRVAGGRRGLFAAFRSDGAPPWNEEEAKFLEFFTAVFTHIADGAHPALAAPLESRIRDRTLRLTQANELLRREITERKRIQSALSESIERFELAAQGSNDGLWDARILTNRDSWRSGQIHIWYSARFKQVLGYEDWEFENTLENWAVRLHPDDRERVLTALDDHLYRKVPYDVEYRILNKKGQYGWCQARGQALWDENGLPVRMAGSLRDVTERKIAAQELSESEERYRKLVELSPDAILVLCGTKLAYINPTGARMLGFENEQVDPCIDLARFVSEETLDRLTRPQSSVSGPSREVHEDHLTRADGEVLSIEWVTAPIHYAGQPASMAMCRDVTERKKSEAALRQEREVLRQLLNAHERERQLVSYEIHDGLGQYLVGAVMRMEALGEQLPPVPQSCRDQWELAMHLVKTSLREARRLISGLRPPILDEYGIVSAIEYLIQEPKGDGGPNIAFDSDVHFDRLAPILETTIFRIVQEAVSNAKRHGKARNIVIHLSDDDGRICLRIRDDGVGFSPDRAAQGKGYGLQGMRERARLLGGKAVIRSRPEEGAVVEVDLPLVDPQPEIAGAGVRVGGP